MEIRFYWVTGVGYAISGVLYFCTCVYVQYTCALVWRPKAAIRCHF